MNDAHKHDGATGGHDHAGHSHAGHDHGALGHSHGGADKNRTLIAACLTGVFMVAEAAGGVLTGSLALLADAGHMLIDTVSLVLAWYAFRLAERSATSQLTFGFDRVKTLVAYTNGLTVFVMALWITYEAIYRIAEPAPVLGGPMLTVAIVGLAVNIAAFFVLHGGDRDNLNMRGALLHVLGDLLGSVAAIVAAGIILATGWFPADPILSVLVAVLLFRSSWNLLRESGNMLLEGVPSGLDRNTVASDIQANVAGVNDIHHMHLWSMDGQRHMATLHARLDDGTDADATILAIKQRLMQQHGIEHVTIEPEFGTCADARQRVLH